MTYISTQNQPLRAAQYAEIAGEQALSAGALGEAVRTGENGRAQIRLTGGGGLRMGASALVPPALVAIGGAYGAATMGMSVYLAARARRVDVLPYLPAAFAILHVGYGLGFLRGLYQFRDRWADTESSAPRPSPQDREP